MTLRVGVEEFPPHDGSFVSYEWADPSLLHNPLDLANGPELECKVVGLLK